MWCYDGHMLAISLQSGSNGNSIYVEANGVRLLFDAGISGREAELRLRSHRRDIRDTDALIISHDHTDHVRTAGIYQRKFHLPIYVTAPTLSASDRHNLGPLGEIRYFRVGERLQFGPVTVETIPTPHDAADGCVFIVQAGKKRLGIFTDLGHVFEGLSERLASLDAVFLESNYDPDMLRAGSYPAHLKRRIRGPHGHISNVEAAELLADHGKRLRWAALAHMSRENNTPELALQTHRKILGGKKTIHLATRYDVSAPFRV